MKKMIKFLRNLRCKHEDTKVITNLDDTYKEIYRANSILICTKCGKVLKSSKTYNTNVINFTPKGDD